MNWLAQLNGEQLFCGGVVAIVVCLLVAFCIDSVAGSISRARIAKHTGQVPPPDPQPDSKPSPE